MDKKPNEPRHSEECIDEESHLFGGEIRASSLLTWLRMTLFFIFELILNWRYEDQLPPNLYRLSWIVGRHISNSIHPSMKSGFSLLRVFTECSWKYTLSGNNG